MDGARYFIRGQTFAGSDARLQDALARVYGSPERPRCMCVPGGVEMYVARHADYVIKRMPDTGRRHHVTCPSFEPEPGTSGLGELIGEAIVEHAPERFEIRTAFPLSRIAGRVVSPAERVDDPPAVTAPRKRMSLRAVLHFLYERAGFNRWYPAMEGKRSQAVIRHFLLAAAHGVTLKGEALEDRLFVPERFRAAEADEIANRRRCRLAMLLSPESDVQFRMAVLIGQLGAVEATPYGRRLIVKHMPDAPLYIDDRAWRRAERAYGAILQAVDADVERKPRVLMAALVHAGRERIYRVDSLSLMLVTDQWIPLDGMHELPLIEALQREGRQFIKPLRYDAKSAAGFANALLLDAGPAPMALHVLSPFMSARDRAEKARVLRAAGRSAWAWATDSAMPELPPRVSRPRQAMPS